MLSRGTVCDIANAVTYSVLSWNTNEGRPVLEADRLNVSDLRVFEIETSSYFQKLKTLQVRYCRCYMSVRHSIDEDRSWPLQDQLGCCCDGMSWIVKFLEKLCCKNHENDLEIS